MPGEIELAVLLQNLQPVLHPGRFVFSSVECVPVGVRTVATMVEEEGTTVVVDQDAADRLGLPYEFAAAMLTLRVHSSLSAVGLTAAVAATLTAAGISCNVISGYFHDHVFVPAERGGEALALLEDLAGRHRRSQQ